LLLVALFLWVTACTSYTQIQLDEVADHGKVRVTTVDGERETVHSPRVEADSIRGHVNEGVGQAARTISVDQVAKVETTESNTVGTVLLVVGSLAVVLLLVSVQQCNGFECG
jgi:hypothetical protein